MRPAHAENHESKRPIEIKPFTLASGGWTSVKEVTDVLLEAHIPVKGTRILLKQNKADGFACVSCAWAKPAKPHPAEFCEHGAKSTAWELTTARTPPAFFAEHTLTELEQWSDHALEFEGRLTAPLRYDAATDRYVEVSWQAAFDEIGSELRQLQRQDPESVVFYSSGRASLEASYMYQLMARLYGNNNLPDSSNMCHESTSVGLPKTLGVPVGTVTLEDFEHTDCIFIIGHNVGTNSPRMLHPLEEARARGVPIVTFNPLREPGLVHFANPQSPIEMLTPKEAQISTQYHQVRPGGDIAALTGICKWLIEWDDAARVEGRTEVLDRSFIREHTHGYDDLATAVRGHGWAAIEATSGLTRDALKQAAAEFAKAKNVMAVYGMGLTQHRSGVLNVQMVSNLLLLGGHIGRPGAGICPVRGHSNVQGQRTVGITEKPEQAPMAKLKELYHFEPPMKKGLNTVEACEGMLAGSVRAMISLGGNLLRAVPDATLVEGAWRKLRLSVQVATKLNRSHVVHGEVSFLLPCLGRIEIDLQNGVEQAVSVEDSTGCMHGSRGFAEPASAQLMSEMAIIAGIAKATLPPRDSVPWDAWAGDHALIRKAIERTFPAIFGDFEKRMWLPGGFHRPVAAAHRTWNTDNKRANFIAPDKLETDADVATSEPGVIRLMTLRSFDQFNTTVYGYDDRYRGIHGTRMVLLMHADDIEEKGLANGDYVDATTVVHDGIVRTVKGLRVTAYDIPRGCAAGYFPECNPLVPLWHHAEGSKVPGYKSIPIRIAKTGVEMMAD